VLEVHPYWLALKGAHPDLFAQLHAQIHQLGFLNTNIRFRALTSDYSSTNGACAT